MKLQKNTFSAKYLYHYTTRERAQQILKEHTVRRGNDRFTFFTASREDAAKVCRNVMKEGTFYIDDSLTVRQREKTDLRDYVILKIQCPAETDFYQLSIEHPEEQFCAYDYSLMHSGDLHFRKGKILSMDTTVASSCKKAVSRAALFGGTCLLLGTMCTSRVYAANSGWLDSPANYDTNWWEKKNYELSGAKQLAGLSYLTNYGGDDGKGIAMSGVRISIKNDIDLSARKWSTIPKKFEGSIEGVHKVVITLAEGDTFIADKSKLANITIRYVAREDGTEEEQPAAVACQHVMEQVLISDATAETDAVIAEKCSLCGDTFAYYDAPGTACASFLKKTADAIRQTTEGEVVVDTRLWTCLDKQVTDALMERRDVALTINYTYQGKRYTVTIPAGTDASALLDENGYCGFRYLDLLYHGSALEE